MNIGDVVLFPEPTIVKTFCVAADITPVLPVKFCNEVFPVIVRFPLIVPVVPVKDCNEVFPVTVRFPLTVNPVTVLNNTPNVPPVLFVYVNVLSLYVTPVTLISVGRF